jgi:hypothetical protein
MAENHPSTSRPDGPAGPGVRRVAPVPELLTVNVTGGMGGVFAGQAVASATAVRGPAPSSRPTCSGTVSWLTLPEREIRECVLLRGHGGDHRDAAGYPWNEGRWLD